MPDTPASAAAKPAPTIAWKIDNWFAECFYNSAVSRGPSEVFNAVRAAKEDLKIRFSAKDAPTGPAAGAAIEAWYVAHIGDSPVARAPADVLAVCRAATDKLKVLLGA